MPGGRPTKYKPEYCEMLIKHGQDGLSYESFAGVIDVNVDTLYEWEKVYPEFSEAKNNFRAKSLLFWDKVGIEGLWEVSQYDDDGNLIYKKKLNTTNWIFQMKNRHNWRDKTEVEFEQKSAFKFNYSKEDLDE